MNTVLSLLKNKRTLPPLIMFLFFVAVLIYSLSTSRNTISESPIAPTYAPSRQTTTQLPGTKKTKIVVQKLIHNYTTAYGPADYTFSGTKTYGQTVMVFVYLKRGIALVTNVKTTQVYEEWRFKPMSKEQFQQAYKGEILDFTIYPTTTPE